MELSVNRNTVRINEPVFDATVDHPMECDVVLPDYCPDIARILSSDAGANINKRTIETDCLTADGTFFVKIIYVPDNSCSVRCFTYENDFSHTFEAEGIKKDDMVCCKARVDYITCRQIGPRRLQIKASVAVHAKVWRKRCEELVSSCDDNRVEMLSRSMKESVMVGMCEKMFDVEEELEIGYGKPAAAAIIKCDALATVKDYKVIKNKVIAKGDLLLQTMYSPDISQNNLECITHTIPLSQIIEIDGVDDDSVCTVGFEVMNIKMDAAEDSDGENRLLNACVTVSASVCAYNTEEITVSEDAYSPVFDMELEKKTVTIEYISDVTNNEETVKSAVEVPGDGISSVVGCIMKLVSYDAKIDGKQLVINGEITASVMATDMQGSPMSFDKTLPFTITEQVPAGGDNMRCEADMRVNSLSYSFSLNGIDIRTECTVSVIYFAIMSGSAISDMSLNEESPRKNRQKTLTLYFADKGEKVWDIAKRYNTSVDAVMKENNCESDSVPDRLMLLIPRKHCARDK